MTSLFFQRAEKSEINSLFCESFLGETVVSDLERAIAGINLKSKAKVVINCSTDDIFYAVKFIPKEISSKNISKCTKFDIKSSSKNVSMIFNIKTSFFIITSKSNITLSQSSNIISRISSAFVSLGIKLPFFIQIGAKESHKYIGKMITKQLIYNYDSHSLQKEYNLATKSNIDSLLQPEISEKSKDNNSYENFQISSRFIFNSLNKDKDLTAIFAFPKLPYSEFKDYNVALASKAYAQINFKPPDAQESMLKKAIKYASNQATHWPTTEVKSNTAKNLFSKVIPLNCERKLKGAVPGGILEQIAQTMYNESFTTMWLSFIQLLTEHVNQKKPIENPKSDKMNSLMQQKLNMFNSALYSHSSGRSCYQCSVCDDDLEKLKIEIKKLAAVLPETTYERLEEIANAIIDFRGKNEFATYDAFKQFFNSQSKRDESKEISLLWDQIPSHLTESKEGLDVSLTWFKTISPAEVHLEMILILVSSELRNLTGGAEMKGAFAQQALARAVSKATTLETFARLQAPLDFLKSADDIANIISEGTVGVEMLKNAMKLFPGATDFIDALMRNGFAQANGDARQKLADVVNGKNVIKFEQSISVTVSGEKKDKKVRVFMGTERKKTVIGVTNVESNHSF
ncbi:hypothetical protein TVAG_090480 [Trichomonas vaginalis G3]|uniref:Uncharacterized protein n=1 Tax=Trichomonas vaginalis (strain ATCC PRA-98 / G3) TaxID=412133 RepID=A2FA05_TRIV3|nr:hypothetical protein TVAGG3_0730110 [Trichomonas vaginalis G3]EAX98272.1 hypothetical protein TVAG_090480 [Trichomonas vaginalis G3]KAI5511198.1 hypothetical protein TVAGG3_0730110 [Trichomonas vaginalis G3]|eukprot:XP_001311202.1 hypothetical protein [Trichomonas vaginalis G3]